MSNEHFPERPGRVVSDTQLLAYMERQLRSGRVKPAVLVPLTQKAFAEADHEQILRCFSQLDSSLLKR
jgi:hypothetical protein